MNNFAVVYDQELASRVIYILPEGESIDTIVKDGAKALLFSSDIVAIKVGQLVAEDYLPKYYPGEWVFFSSYTLYDLDGIPAAYAYIFRDPKSTITTSEELTTTIKATHAQKNQIENELSQLRETKELTEIDKNETLLRLRNNINKLKRALYQSNAFATVITGASETSSLLIRCYKGVPIFLVKRDDIKAELKSQYAELQLQLGRIIYLNPLDIRYEAKKRDGVGKERVGQQVADDSYLVSYAKNKLTLISVALKREKLQVQLEEQVVALERTSGEYMERLKESERNKEQHYKRRWKPYQKNRDLKGNKI